MTSLWAMMRKEFIHIGRDPQLVAFMVGLPVLLLMLFGYALRLTVDNMVVAVWDQEQNFFSASAKDRLRQNGQFTITEVGSEAAIRALLQSGDARLGMIIPKGFGERLLSYQETTFPLYVDGSMPTLAQAALYGANTLTSDDAFAAIMADDPDHPAPPHRPPPVKIDQVILFNPDLHDSDFFLPGTVGVVIMVVVLTLSLGLVREKEQQTIEQLLVTPISRLALIAGKLIPYGIVAGLDFGVALVLAWLVFALPFRGSMLAIGALAVLFIFSLLALGALIAAVSRTQMQATFLAIFVIVPSVEISGFVFPIEAIPAWLRPAAWSLPMTYFMDAMRGLTLKGTGMGDHVLDFAVLAAFTVGFTLISLLFFRKQMA